MSKSVIGDILVEKGLAVRAEYSEDGRAKGVEIEKIIIEEHHIPYDKICIMERLTINRAQELFDKVIEWKAPAAEGNYPYGGKAIITDLKASNRPIVATILEGDNLNYAICEDDMHVDFSDYGRGVMFRIVDEQSIPDITANGEVPDIVIGVK